MENFPEARPIILKALGGPFPGQVLKKTLRDGGIIAFPTETFYGLGTDPFNEEAVKKLFLLKGRPPEKPVSIVVKDMETLYKITEEVPGVAKTLIKKFWPGPLTIVFRAGPKIPKTLTGGTGKIAVRIPGSSLTLEILATLSSPLTATSANPSGKEPPTTAGEVLKYFDGKIDVLVDKGERLAGKKGSTVIDVTEEKTEVLREGEIPSEEIFRALKTRGSF